MKIKELVSNQLCTIPLAVISATSRETRAGKPYLALELFDGTESILGNFWDWGGKSIPQNNTILDVTAQVTEWQGNKQLNVKSMTTNTEMNIADFMPSSGHDVSAVYDMAVAMAETVEDTMLRASNAWRAGTTRKLLENRAGCKNNTPCVYCRYTDTQHIRG